MVLPPTTAIAWQEASLFPTGRLGVNSTPSHMTTAVYIAAQLRLKMCSCGSILQTFLKSQWTSKNDVLTYLNHFRYNKNTLNFFQSASMYFTRWEVRALCPTVPLTFNPDHHKRDLGCWWRALKALLAVPVLFSPLALVKYLTVQAGLIVSKTMALNF
jgi:hypothetical protein